VGFEPRPHWCLYSHVGWNWSCKSKNWTLGVGVGALMAVKILVPCFSASCNLVLFFLFVWQPSRYSGLLCRGSHLFLLSSRFLIFPILCSVFLLHFTFLNVMVWLYYVLSFCSSWTFYLRFLSVLLAATFCTNFLPLSYLGIVLRTALHNTWWSCTIWAQKNGIITIWEGKKTVSEGIDNITCRVRFSWLH
jgi:hypothetical protein